MGARMLIRHTGDTTTHQIFENGDSGARVFDIKYVYNLYTQTHRHKNIYVIKIFNKIDTLRYKQLISDNVFKLHEVINNNTHNNRKSKTHK